MNAFFITLIFGYVSLSKALRYEPDHVHWNLNENADAVHPLDYSGKWENHTFHSSPSTWRFPFYVVTLDRFIDGDPTNNEANGTHFEHEWMTNQYRFGGDLVGLRKHLDYLRGMGIKALYLTGSPFINMPWAGDGYGPLDFTLLDHHHGMIQDWRDLVEDVHSRDMYVILDNTLATMGDLLAFNGFVNATTPFSWAEYDLLWKSDRRYHDFDIGNEVNASCEYPKMWTDEGYPVGDDILDPQKKYGCRISDFDAYGDMEGVGDVPPYQEQLSKFASVQDRLRAWKPDVFEKLVHFSCLQIQMLDIDGFRIDKALQTPVEVHADFTYRQKQCARALGKDNFLVVGEVVGDASYSAIFIGRGKQPNQAFNDTVSALTATNETDSDLYLRPAGKVGLDGSAFHYPTYGALTRFLGLNGPIGIDGVDFVQQWEDFLSTDDMVNGETGVFDPRHMFGTTNQDVFRWPSLANGTHRQLLGIFITMLQMPGIPMVYFGEEQKSYILENLADNYVYGRTPMGSSAAWQLHGCYHLTETTYVDMPFDSARYGCHDKTVSYNHLDPTHPLRSIYKRMFELRQQFPVLNDGFDLRTLSTKLYDIYLAGSDGIPSPTGIWSIYRGASTVVQNFTEGQGNQGVWLMYSNKNETAEYIFNCSSSNTSEALVSPFAAGTTVKNLLYPYEEFILENTTFALGISNLSDHNGCLSSLTMKAWGFMALVPADKFVTPSPTMTKFVPGHDARIESLVESGQAENITVEFHFSQNMTCAAMTDRLTISSTTDSGEVAKLDESSVQCTSIDSTGTQEYVAEVGTAWIMKAQLTNVYHGIHQMTLDNVTASSTNMTTNARDTLMFRIGKADNPVVFPWTANYTKDLLHQDGDRLWVTHKAAGADKWRYSLNFESSWSSWTTYTGGNDTLEAQSWSGTKAQRWSGDHVILQYWSEKAGSSDHIQHGDANTAQIARRWPHAFVQGEWNEYGYDDGLVDKMALTEDGWTFVLAAEWPQNFSINVWGMDPDGAPDKIKIFGDVDGDGVLDLLPPDSLSNNVLEIKDAPGMPHTAWKIYVKDGDWRYSWKPTGSAYRQCAVFFLLAILPFVGGCLGATTFCRSFYQVKHNQVGFSDKNKLIDMITPAQVKDIARNLVMGTRVTSNSNVSGSDSSFDKASGLAADTGSLHRRTVLIATMEYEIEDWDIKIKIGGLGVMANLMGKNLGHQNLIWVVPCVGGVQYPPAQRGQPIIITVMGRDYAIDVQYHVVRNISYVLLDAPIFRQQTKAEPYPARMDDLESAVYYSAWNACIAEVIKRFPSIDLYHINDYHGALAPLYLLPNVIPVCLSLHNAEFQGLWPIRNEEEMSEISAVFNLDKGVIRNYVQFGEVFNLLHAGASYLRVHQKGFGAVGVSKKYGKRSLARYPIFWGLSRIGALPNPDPSDQADWDENEKVPKVVEKDLAAEALRGDLRVQAQEWAGLSKDPTAELFVFVGRWSMQKGVDAIADVFPAILEKYPKTQLICVGPVIDLYGKFAALKLAKLMELYPGRVCSKPQFTVLPPYIFSGAEFTLIPSRDEPFGLVAVEFGRKGALGVGARVGGLGQMPGWWYTVESTSIQHLIRQFKSAIKSALAASQETRAEMRARSAVQRFPIAQWVRDLEILQITSIAKHHQVINKSFGRKNGMRSLSSTATNSVVNTAVNTAANSPTASHRPSRRASRATSPNRRLEEDPATLRRAFGPGHDIATGAILRPITRSRRNSLSPIIDPVVQIKPVIYDGDIAASAFNSPSDQWFPDVPSHPTSDASSVYNFENQDRFATQPWDVSASTLSVQQVTGKLDTGSDSSNEKFKLEQVDPFFTDSTESYYKKFDKLLDSLNASNSENKFCIEEYLNKSSKDWFNRFHNEKLTGSKVHLIDQSSETGVDDDLDRRNFHELLGSDYVAPSGISHFLQRKIGDWPVYTFLLAVGQIIAASSYQITLLAGKNGQTAEDLYIIASIYLAGTLIWWTLFRRVASVWALSIPFAFYGLAFFLIGVSGFSSSSTAEGWVQNVATGFYSLASSSGSLFFSLNFGSEGGSSIKTWTFRACVVQGTQQIYVALLWLWGDKLSSLTTSGASSSSLVLAPGGLLALGLFLSLACWAIGILLFLGLPGYYRSRPGSIPSLYKSVYHRKIIPWFLVVVIIQNYFMATQTGRNWKFLFSSSHAPWWSVFMLMIIFFIGIWSLLLLFLGRLSLEHSWIFPIFAIGLGAPRWCQMLWGTSGMGLYIPWTVVGSDPSSPASFVASALVSRSLWLWLGVLDALQGVGFGMILMQTLTRVHIAFTLMSAQAIGSIITMLARATAPDATGPGWVFPNLATSLAGLHHFQFWLCLLLQCSCCVGFFMFFRKEQLFKP